MDSRKESTYTLEPEAITDIGGKYAPEDEETASTKEGGNLDTKLNIINESAEDGDDNECEVSLSVAVEELEMVGTQEVKEEMVVKGDSAESQAWQLNKENEESVLACTSVGQSNNDAGSAMDTAC